MHLNLLTILLSGTTLASGAFAGPNNFLGGELVPNCSHSIVHHYDYLEPTDDNPGHKEFYVCCGCHQVWFELPANVKAIDTDESKMTGGLGTEHPAYLEAGYPTAAVNKVEDVTIPYGKLNLDMDCLYNFTSKKSAYEINETDYKYWHADYEVSFDCDMNQNGGDTESLFEHGGVMLVGHYDAFCAMKGTDWLPCELSNVKAGDKVRLLSDVLNADVNYLEIGLLGYSNYNAFYDYVEDNSIFPMKNSIVGLMGKDVATKLQSIDAGTYEGYSAKGFTCGAVAIAGDSMPTEGFTMTVTLKLYETSDFGEYGTYNHETGNSIDVMKIEHHFSASDYIQVK